MYSECKSYLVGLLKTAGIKTKPYTSMAALGKSMESHLGAVIFENEALSRNGSKKQFTDDGARKKRKKVFDRNLTFTVTIGEYSDDAVEEIYENFLAGLDQGIYVKGSYVPIEVEDADWVDKDDSILKSKVAVQVKVTFDGGVYKDTSFAKIGEIEIASVEREEPIDGN